MPENLTEVTVPHEPVGQRTPSDATFPWNYWCGGRREPELQYLGETIFIWITLEYHQSAGSYSKYKLGEATCPEELWNILWAWRHDPQTELNRIGYTAPSRTRTTYPVQVSSADLDDILSDLDLNF